MPRSLIDRLSKEDDKVDVFSILLDYLGDVAEVTRTSGRSWEARSKRGGLGERRFFLPLVMRILTLSLDDIKSRV